MANYRNPNGYGSVVKLSGRRRKPYAVRKTVGWDDRAYPIYEIIGYYPTRADAMIALANYNQDPYDIALSKITLKGLFEKWSDSELPKLGASLQAAHKSAYNYCKKYENIEYKTLRKFQMQECIDTCGKSGSTQTNIRNLWSTLDKYAYDMDIISKCYSANLTTKQTDAVIQRKPFTKEEIKNIENHIGTQYYDETMFMLYTGCRVSEMLTCRCEDIDIENRTLVLGVKTEAGKNRIIPIHKNLIQLIENHIGGEYLFEYPRSDKAKNPTKALVIKFLHKWSEIFPDHDTHDCRHTFRSALDKVEANKVCINLIMGHKSGDIGERVYTHKTVDDLISTIDLLDYSI